LTSVSSDDVAVMMADNATQVAHDKLEGLDLEALGLTDAVIDAVGLEKAALDFYMAGAWGSLERQGAAGYDGYGFVTTAGADYLVTPDLLLGGSVFYEWGRLEYDALINGKVVRDGWRGDLYGGWQLDTLLSVEGFTSYGRFANEVTANFDKGRADSERWMSGAKIASQFDALGAGISPYASATYLYERIDGYTTAGGTVIAAASAELSQGAFGFEIDGHQAVALGLSPFITLQGEWDWINGGDIALTNGAVLTADDWGLTWSSGLRGQLTGFAPGSWIGALLEGAQVSLEYTESTFGRANTSRTLDWALSVPM
jgi:outer membrane autotransporter protein